MEGREPTVSLQAVPPTKKFGLSKLVYTGTCSSLSLFSSPVELKVSLFVWPVHQGAPELGIVATLHILGLKSTSNE